MTTKVSDKICLVVCSGLFVSIAERLARDFKKVYLYVPYAGNFPTMSKGMLGHGLENVERVDGIFGPHFDSVDLFVFVDLGHAALQIHLEKLGKRVWGPRNAEEQEIYRELCKEQMEGLGLPVQPWTIVKGVTALEAHLRSHKNQLVKIDKWRGVTETFFAPSFDIVEPKVHAIAETLGPFKEELEFIVENELPDCVEAGIDTFTIDGQYPAQTLVGIEVKDCGYLGQFVSYASIPEPLRRWNDAFAPLFAQYGARGTVSNEVRIGKDKVPYMIDATIRAPSPPSELMQELWTNFSEIIWEGAGGVLVEPIPAAKWGVEVIVKSAWAEHNLQLVDYPEEFANQIKLYNLVIVDGKRYVVCQDDEMTEIGAVVGWGDTPEEAFEHAKKAGESLKGYQIKFEMGAADKAYEQIEELAELGVSPFKLEKQANNK
jgi:hypothetical protein